jgi:hypothetical protein
MLDTTDLKNVLSNVFQNLSASSSNLYAPTQQVFDKMDLDGILW